MLGACQKDSMFPTPKMTCKETIRLICEYLDGKLSPGVEREVRQHVDACKDCRLVMEAARKTLEVYFNWSPESVSQDKVKVA